MQKRNDVQAEARRWIGTPVIHQHQLLGVGVDCWGHVRATGEGAGVLTVDAARWAQFAGYSRQPSPKVVLGVCRAFLKPRQVAMGLPGDIACIAWRTGLPMHLAILGEFRGRATLIHADARRVDRQHPTGQVVEHGFTQEWPGLVHSWWRFPGVEAR